jgi:hypothetical protein
MHSYDEGIPMNQQLIEYLESLKKTDIDTRSRLIKEGRLFGGYEPEMQEVHRQTAYALEKVISTHGWPGVSKVGVEGATAAWLIAQHAICTPRLQRKFLQHLSRAAETGDAPLSQVAFLTDRILHNEGKPQIYGTVLDWNENGELTCELENRDKVDELRADVGLPPFEQACEEHRRGVEAEGGKPPENYDAYKRAAREWAESVGWR